MQTAEIIQRLFDLGHFHNPDRQQGVELADIGKLKLHDKAVVEAIKSYQEFMRPDLEDFSEIHHHRAAVIDGEVGPATNDLFDFPRCGFPDYPVPEGTLAMGRQEANWPTACRGKLRIGRDFKSLPGSTEEKTHGVWWASANNWTWALEDHAIDVAEVGDSNVQFFASLKRLSGSTLAWSYLAQNTCNVRLAQAFNTRTNWGNDAFAAAVKTHEDGHAIGLPHNNDRDALMYPSIHARSQGRRGYPNATDLRGCKAIGYTLSGKTEGPPEDKLYLPRDQWDGPDPEPEPPTPPGPNEYWFRGDFELMRGDEALGRFILTPKPEV